MAIGEAFPTKQNLIEAMRISVERAIEFNNAGVRAKAAGYQRVAWELFKGALEVKLAVERYETEHGSLVVSSDSSGTHKISNAQKGHKYNTRLQHRHQIVPYPDLQSHSKPEPSPPPYPSNAFIEQAERHMAMFDTYLRCPVVTSHRTRSTAPANSANHALSLEG